MNTCLVVANRTLPTERLAEVIRDKIASGDTSFYVVVPVTPTGAGLTWDHTEAADAAEHRLEQFLEAVRAQGATAQGEIGDPDPVMAVQDVMRNRQVDEIVLSTLPAGLSRWLAMDIPSKLNRAVDVPVTVVTQEAAVGASA